MGRPRDQGERSVTGPHPDAGQHPLEAPGAEKVRGVRSALNPTGRLVAAEDVAATVVFLRTDAASMINGRDTPLDRGQLAKL